MDLSSTFAKFRKQVAGLGLVALVVSMFATGVASAQTVTGQVWKDVPTSHWAFGFINDQTVAGTFDSPNTTNGSMFRPGDNIRRSEMAATLVRATGMTKKTATAAPFKDVAMGQWYTDDIYTLSSAGIVSGEVINGQPTGYYYPNGFVKRSEAAKFIVNGFMFANDTAGGPHFPDVASAAWYYNFVETAFNNKIVSGYPDGMYRPGNDVNRAEIAAMLARAQSGAVVGFVLDDAGSASATTVMLTFSMTVDAATAADKANYTIVDSTGGPLAVSAAAVQTDKTMVLLTTATQTAGKTYYVTAKNLKSEAGDALANTDSVSFLGYGADVSGGALSVALSSQTPVQGSVPSGAQGVVFTCWDFKAGASAVVLKSLHVHRVGPGSQDAFEDVYLYKGDTRLTTGRSVNSDTQVAEFNNVNLSIAANENAKVCLVGDLTTLSNGGVHAFEIAAAADVMTNSSNMTGSFPLRGADQLITNADVGSLDVLKNGSLDEVTVGQKDARVAQFELSAGSEEKVNLKRLSLYVRGSVSRGDLVNFKLYSLTGEKLAEVAGVDSNDLATFSLPTAYVLDKGESKIFYVTADIVGARNGDTIKIYFDEKTDLFATGGTYGYGVRVTINSVATGYDGIEGFSQVTVKGSDFMILSNPLASTEVANNQDDAICLDLSLINAAGSDLTISDWQFLIEDTSVSSDIVNTNYTQFKLVKLNADGSVGSTILGSNELTAVPANSQPLTLTGEYTLPSDSTTRAGLVFDVQDSVAPSEIRCTLNPVTTGEKVVDMNNDALGEASITPNTAISGNVLDVVASQLTVTRATSVQATSYTKGTPNANLLGLQFKAGSAQNQTIKEIKLGIKTVKDTSSNLVIDACDNPIVVGPDTCTKPSDSVYNVQLMDGATVLATENVVNASGTTGLGEINFRNLTVSVPKDTTKTLIVRATLNNNADAELIGVYLNGATSVVAIDGQGRNTTGIDVDAINEVAEAPVMMIATPDVTGSGSTLDANKTLVAAEETFETMRFKLRSANGDTTLQDFVLAITMIGDGYTPNTNSEVNALKSVGVHKLVGGVCGPVLKTGTVDTVNGRVVFDNVGIVLPNNVDTTICISITNNTIAGSTELTSGEHIGLKLVNTGDAVTVTDGEITDLRDSTNTNIAADVNVFTAKSPVNTSIFRSMPKVTKNSISTQLSSGTIEVANLTLDKLGENLTLNELHFKLAATGITGISGCALYNGSDAITDSYTDSGFPLLQADFVTVDFIGNAGYTVDSTKTLSLKCSVTLDGLAQTTSLGVTLSNTDTGVIQWNDGNVPVTAFGGAIIKSPITWSLN